jgi:hypothetical protein
LREATRALTALALAAFALLWLRPDPVAQKLDPSRAAGPSPRAGEGREEGPLPFRDPFRFVEKEGPKPARRVPPPLAARPSPTPEASAVTLLGLMRSPRGLEAVLSIGGEVIVARAGEALDGYTLVALDEDRGARLRDPSGREFVLPPS